MPSISKIRFTNVVYENGNKRYNNEVFQFDGQNGAIILENGGGKTVFIQTAIQSVLPHAEVAERKIKNTLSLENSPAHIAIEWILNESPRRYALTAVTLFINKSAVDSYKYVYEYSEGDDGSIENLPFVLEGINGTRPAGKDEIGEYYSQMSQKRMNAHNFSTIKEYHQYIENNFKIVPSEWRKIALINGGEGDVEAFFNACQTTGQLVDNLLIPTVEESLSGNGTKEFAETFEKQREHFKKYNQLKGRIEESKNVENHINKYVNIYQEFDNINSEVIKIKEKMKGLYNFLKAEEQNNIKKLENNLKDQKSAEEEENYFNQKSESYNLELQNQKKIKAQKKYQEALDDFNRINQAMIEKANRRENLRLSKIKQTIKIQNEKIEQLKEQILKLDQDQDISELIEELNQNSSELKGYYKTIEDKLNKEKSVIEGQLNNITEEKNNNKAEYDKTQKKVNNLNNKKVKLDYAIESSQEKMESIKKSILLNPETENIEDEKNKWVERISILENLIYQSNKDIKEYEKEKESINNQIPGLREETLENNKSLALKNSELENLNSIQDNLLIKIKEFRSSWYSFDNLYLKQSTIISQLENNIEKLRAEKEDLIFNERKAHRFLDDYSESKYYTADYLLEKIIKNIRNQFAYIETGTQYIQKIAKNTSKSEYELSKKYPYWAITVVTSETEREKVIAKIEAQCDNLTHPVIVLSEKEARDKFESTENIKEDNIIFPDSWQKNIEQSYFENFKNKISEKASEATEERKSKEIEFRNCDDLLKELNKFYQKYSYQKFTEMQSSLEELNNKNNYLSKQINEKEERIKFIDGEFKRINKIVSGSTEENTSLENKIIKANEYIEKKKENHQKEIEINKLQEKLSICKEELIKWEKRINQNKEIEEEIKANLENTKSDLRVLQAEELYSEVKNVDVKYSNKAKESLKEQRKIIIDALDKKQKGRDSLEQQIESASEIKKSNEDELINLRKQLGSNANEELDFLVSGDIEISTLIDQINELKLPLKKSEKTLKGNEKLFNTEETIYNKQKEDFYNKYDEIIAFSISLSEVSSILEEEKKKLELKKKAFFEQKYVLEKEEKSINDAIILLEKYNTKYLFLAVEIKEEQLQEDFLLKFTYNRKEVTEKIIKEIESLSDKFDIKKESTENEKNDFIKFCENDIKDARLREMAVSGVKSKNFKGLLEWQNNMKIRIAKTIEIAENDLREHDKEVQQFINHLHSYLVTMASELRQIPKKTKIKVDNSWKEVYIFNVPDWNEKEGKEEISKHIDWMVKELESVNYKDENGIEIDSKVKASINKWLQSKQLLQIVMKNAAINVKCRKVTNDEKMSSQPFSWEVSNKWSGGERWSKNMTLFLGILNYLAEKRVQITPNHKFYRTVILDNPFGKASSEHVLNPVFFVAQQLGFQIIALTAHAEGKFIRDYFPIVYSCKLREAVNGTTQIMTKEKEIRQAYFRDKDPLTLERLGQIEQMNLFDI